MSILEIANIWKNQGLNLNEPTSVKMILDLENHLDFKFPDDFKEFYKLNNGFVDHEWNSNMFSIWSLDRIEEAYNTSTNEFFIPFCDFMMNSHQIGFSRVEDGVFINYENHKLSLNDKVSDTFTGALIEIVKDSDKIY